MTPDHIIHDTFISYVHGGIGPADPAWFPHAWVEPSLWTGFQSWLNSVWLSQEGGGGWQWGSHASSSSGMGWWWICIPPWTRVVGRTEWGDQDLASGFWSWAPTTKLHAQCLLCIYHVAGSGAPERIKTPACCPENACLSRRIEEQSKEAWHGVLSVVSGVTSIKTDVWSGCYGRKARGSQLLMGPRDIFRVELMPFDLCLDRWAGVTRQRMARRTFQARSLVQSFPARDNLVTRV